MSKVASRVQKALDERSTTETDTSTESSSITTETLREAVQEGVTEALDKRAAQRQESGGMDQSSEQEESSGSRFSLKRIIALGVVVSLVYFVRRRLQGGSDEPASTGPSHQTTE